MEGHCRRQLVGVVFLIDDEFPDGVLFEEGRCKLVKVIAAPAGPALCLGDTALLAIHHLI